MIDFFQWLQDTALCTSIRESSLTYPILLTAHLTILAIFGGMVLVSDLRLLGFALTGLPVSTVVGGLRIWKRVGAVLMISVGLLLFSSKAVEYFQNPYFHVKVTLLALAGIHALYFRSRVYSRTADFDGMSTLPGEAKLAAWLSLALWISILVFGRMIGYYDAPGEP